MKPDENARCCYNCTSYWGPFQGTCHALGYPILRISDPYRVTTCSGFKPKKK